MASVDLEYNQGFKIYNANGTRFNNLVLHKATYETVVMSLGDKISGIVYYKNNKLVVNMTEYIMYKDVKYMLVNPPTVIKEGLVSDNGELKGMTKYSFTFYHPMYMLSNFPFSDIAVSTDQQRYLSQNKTFSWIGNLVDYKDKLNKNLEGTQWKVSIGTNVTDAEKNKLSEVLSFDNNTIADALKTAYETWEIPYIVDKVEAGTQDYLINGKRFVVQFGLPSNEIYKKDKNGNFILDDNNQKIPFVFKYGQGVGLKNNSRTPKNNKIVTRIAGYGSEDNIPYGYPQIVWTGNQGWNYTINNDSTAANSYPIYDGIVGGQKVRLIKHPFTRTHLMPPIYSETVNKKVNPNATGYDPNTNLVDYYDADDNTYPNQIKAGEPSYEIHEFEDIKPEFDLSGNSSEIDSATPYDGHSDESITQNKFLSIVDDLYTETDIKAEKTQLNALRTSFVTQQQNSVKGTSGNYEYDWSFKTDGLYKKVKYASSGANFEYVVNVGLTPATIDWDDTMDEQGNYVQSYFKVTLNPLGFDIYASAAITQEMTINMRSGACIGCSFPVMVDWDDYKRNFYDKDGNFAPNGTQRNLTKYPNSTSGSITLILQKETNTFGTLMPNIYQKPASGDKFVILGISLPTSYITTAEGKLETEMKKYMRDNNVYYYEYPLKFDEHFLISNEHILSQMKPNVIVNFEYADVEQSLYIKQMSIKYNESPLPKYDITLTDDVDVVLNKIGEAIAEYRGQRQYENGGGNSETLDGNKFLRKDINDTASGTIRMLKGLQVGERFVTGLLGEGGIFRKDDDGTTYLECDRMYVRMKAYFDTVEVRRFLHSGGNRIASAAGIKCSRVEYIAKYNNAYVVVDANGTYWVNNTKVAEGLAIILYRCYFRAQDNGVSITNDFEIGDQAYCKETNANLGQHSYWRLVIGTSPNPINGEHYIDLSNYMQNGQPASMQLVDSKGVTHFHPSHLAGSDAPIAQDDIIQLGHAYDKTRQGAIVEYVSGEDAPSYQIYQGIDSYSLEDKNYIGLGYSSETKRAYMNVYGDMFIGVKPDAITGKSPTYIKYVQDDGTEQHNPKLTIKGIVEMLSPDNPEETTTLDDFAKAITGDIEYLQQQIDGEIDTWFYDGVPTLSTYPANEWTTDTEKKEHIGDLYYDKLNGNAYRFIYDKDNETYSWLLLSDSAILEALRIANEAKDTADNKRRVFLTDAQHPHPTPPYDEGDLWVNAVWPYQGQSIGSTYNDEILKCIKPVPREEGGSDVTEFSIGDWSAANGYKTALSDFINNTYASFVTNIQTQVDRKAQTWYLGFDPSYSWAGNEKQHVGDLWYCTDDIENTDYKKNTTWIYQERIDPDTGETVYYWAEAAVPDEVFDMIDGKSAIYTEWGAWLDESGASSLQVRDLLIPAADIVRGNVTYKQNKVYRCTNRNTQNPVFEEISYTDDSTVNAIIEKYGEILNITTPTATNVGEALGYLRKVLYTGSTKVDGGLVLTNIIYMKDTNATPSVWAGVSGTYQVTESVTGQYKGHGTAAWYGGGTKNGIPVDYETLTDAQKNQGWNTHRWAKSLFRFDGSGYLAGGNITWDAQGRVAIKDITTLVGGNNTDILNALTTFNNAFHFTTQQGSSTILNINPQYAFSHLEIYDANGNHSVATTDYVNENFVTKAFFNRLFQAYSSSTIVDANKVSPNDTTTAINNLKILVGTWTEQYLSALGNNPNASGGGGISDLSAVLNELNSKDDLGTGVLVRNGLNNWSWMPYNAGTSGIDENDMWTALSTSGNQKIDNSHLSLKSLTFKAGASDANGVVYSPTDNANKTITFDAAANSGISVTKDSNGTFIIGYTMPNVTLSTTISDSDTSYTRFVVDAQGRVVKADKPTTLLGYNIGDAKIENGVITLGLNTITPLTDAKIKSDYTWWGQKLNANGIVSGRINMVASDIYWKENNYGDQFSIGVDFNNTDDNNKLCIKSAVGGQGEVPTLGTKVVITGKSGNVGIGVDSPSCKLHVSGTGYMTGGLFVGGYQTTNQMLYVAGIGRFTNSVYVSNSLTINNPSNTTTGAFLKIGGLYLVYDQANNAIKVSGSSDLSENTTANLYATGAVSALGSQSSGGQDTFNADLMWQELGTNSTAKLIPQSHLNLSGYALTSEVTKTLTIKNSSGNVLGTYDGTQEKTITISGVSGNYLPLTGGRLSGNLESQFSSIDATKSGNNVTTTQWPTAFCILDSGGRIITRTESIVEPESNDGKIGWFSYVRQYDSTHTTNSNPLAQRGIKYMLSKSLVGTWTVDDAPSFRSALGINLDNLVTTNTTQTITGAKTFSSLLTASANASIGGQFLVGASSADYRMHVKGGIVCEYDGTYKGSFRAMRGNFVGAFGVNGSGHTVFTAMSSDGTSTVNYIDITPYNATDKYVLFPYNVKVGVSTSGTATDGAYVQIGGANLVWDASSQLLKCDKLDSVTISTAQTITGVKTFNSAIGVSGGLTPLGTGTVGTANGGSKVWFKRVSSSEAPNNGLVIEYGNSTSWVGQLYVGDNATQGLYWNGWSDGVRGSWTKLAFVSDNVASATKLQTARSLWGNSFNGTADVKGTLNNVSGIILNNTGTGYGYIDFHYASSTSLTSNIYECASGKLRINGDLYVIKYGNVGIGTSEPACKLHVSGTGCMTGGLIVGAYTQQNHMLYVAGSGQFTNSVYVKNSLTINNPDNTTNGAYIQIGSAKLIWDGSALKCDKDFYSTGAVSALGSNTSGGGGGISDISVDASLSGTILTINVSGQSDTVDLSSISAGSDVWRKSDFLLKSYTSVQALGWSGNAEDAIRVVTSNALAYWNGLYDNNSSGSNWHSNLAYCKKGEFGSIVTFNEGSFGANIVPDGNNTRSLGSSSNRWGTIYCNKIDMTGSQSALIDTYNIDTYSIVAQYINAPVNSSVTFSRGNVNFSNNIGVGGSASGDYKLYVNGTSKFTGNVGIAIDPDDDADIRLKVDGDVKAISFVPLSDIRKKDIVDYVIINRIEDIARTPIFNFTWKNREKKTLHLGTSAQYIQEIFPNAVTHFSDGDMGLDYGATALAAAVFTARKVVDHELRIKQLEQENAILRKEIEELKAA